MSQAYPQFTPVQILEAGQRAFAEGRTEYAGQFFHHLIEHYGETAEAAAARDALAQMNGSAAPQYVTRSDAESHAPATAPGYAQPPAANGSLQGVELSLNGGQQNGWHQNGGPAANSYAPTNGHVNGRSNGREANGHEPHAMNNGHGGVRNGQVTGLGNGSANGFGAERGPSLSHGLAQQPHPSLQTRPSPVTPAHFDTQPALDRVPPIEDMPRHIARQSHETADYATATPRPSPGSQRALVPSPEKNYIIGRVIAGLLLLIGILGIFTGIVLVYAAVTDPAIFASFGIATPAQAIMFSGSVFVGSAIALIASQMATAVFDGADAVADLARLERFKGGDYDDEE